MPNTIDPSATSPGSVSRRAALLAAAAALLLAPAAAFAGSDLRPWTGGATPKLALKKLDGKPVSLGDYAGKVVLVNFWATWCTPCIAEMPAMQKLREKLGPAGFEVLAVNYQEGEARINGFLQRRPLDLPIVRDADGAAKTAWGVKVFPTSFVVGPDGRIRLSVVGEVDWLSPKVEEQIRGLLPRT